MSKLFLHPLRERVFSKRKQFASHGEHLFPFRDSGRNANRLVGKVVLKLDKQLK